ncbi:MAG: hypothetical protein J5833_00175, partial [Victivallales bacterium]|nr:hypothetical protein [Victivallales bacterium]
IGKDAVYGDGIPIVGYRDFGKGRVAYLGMYDDLLSIGSKGGAIDKEIMEKVYLKGSDGPESHLARFFRNLAVCLTYNRDLLTNKTYPRAQKPLDDKYDSRQYKGVIGARTTYSTGRSTPAEYVEAAKRIGLDFIVFLEDFENLSYESFEALRKECIQFTSNGFCAMAGFTYKNVDGNNQYIFGNEPLYPGRKVLSDDGKRFKAIYWESENRSTGCDLFYIYSMLSFQCNSGWYNFSANPYPYYDMRSVCCMGLVTQEDGKTIDFSPDAYAGTNRDEQYIIPQALTLMKSADEMALVANGTYFHNEIGADSFTQMVKCLSSHASRSSKNRYPGIPCTGRTVVTQAPSLTLDMPRGDMNPDGDPYNTILNHWPLALEAKSAEAPIESIEILDGITPIRRFAPNAKEFSYRTSIPNNMQHHVWARMKTADGKLAYTRSISSDSWLMRDHYCMDRNNPLYYSLQKYDDGSQSLTSHAADSTTPWKGPWLGRVRPLGFFVEDEKLGTGALRYDGSPEYHPTMWMVPALYGADGTVPPALPHGSWLGALVPGVEGALHNHPTRILFTSDVHVADQVMDGVFPPDAAPVLFTHYTLFPVKKSEYLETTARKTLYRVRPGGMSTYLWQQDYTLLKDLKVGEKGLSVKVGAVNPNGGDKKEGFIGGKKVTLSGQDELNYGDFICYNGNHYGTLVVFVLCDGLKMDGNIIAMKSKGDVPAGTKLQASLLFVGMNRLVENYFESALMFGKDFGIFGRPSYKVDVTEGSVAATDFELKLKGQFHGTVSGLDALPANLPVIVSGMRDNASVILRSPEGVRILGQAEGRAYALLTARENAKPLFIGHPVLADNPSVCVTLSMKEDYKTWQIEFHNPADAEIITRAKAANASGLKLDTELVLPPGGSKFFDVSFENR